jgi:wee1-like protein kinase
MKRKTLTKRSYTKKNRRSSSTTAKMKKGTLITHSQQVQHHQIQSSSATSAAAASSSRFQNVLDSDLIDPQLLAEDVDEKDFILSQDFFW